MVSASAGYSTLQMEQVNNDLQADVESWNALGIPIDAFPSLDSAPYVTLKGVYRHTREFGFSCNLSYFSKEVSTEYNGTEETLLLQRGVSSTNLLFGILYYPAAKPYFLDWYTELRLGYTFARATADGFGTETVKVNGVPETHTTLDTKATYKKSKLILGARVGAEIPLYRQLYVRAEGGYELASIGKMDGEVSRFQQSTTETTSIEFDYSGFQVSLGIGIMF